jgi:hypothetical protein
MAFLYFHIFIFRTMQIILSMKSFLGKQMRRAAGAPQMQMASRSFLARFTPAARSNRYTHILLMTEIRQATKEYALYR